MLETDPDGAAAPSAPVLDLAYAIEGAALPREHRRLLAAAIDAVLPWLATTAGAGIHRLNVSAGSDGCALLSRRTRLVLRVPRERAGDAGALQGRTLDLGGQTLQLGRQQPRELLPWGTLYAHLVATDAADEATFMRQVEQELRARSIACRPICGRRQSLEGGTLQGYSLMLDGLTAAHALRLLQQGLGGHHRLGCGLFVPHRSAAAVGTPP